MDSNAQSEPPGFLYRYRPMSDHLLSEIEHNTIYLAPLNGEFLNDPLEGKFNFVDSRLEDLRSELTRLAVEEGEVEFALWTQLLTDKEVSRIHADAKIIGLSLMKSEEQWGVACFTERFNNKTMWNNYAAQKAGLVLEYGLYQCQIPRGAFWKVKYTQDRGQTSVARALAPSSEGKFSEALSYKTPEWAYEEEWRILCNERGVVKLKIPLTRVIIGPGMAIADKNRVVAALVRNGTPRLAELVADADNYILYDRVRGQEPVTLV